MPENELEQRRKVATISTTTVREALGITLGRFRDWRNQKLITPTLPSLGQGTKAGFSKGDVYSIALFKKMIDDGYKRELATSILKGMGTLENPIIFSPYLIFSTKNEDGKPVPVVNYIAGMSKVGFKVEHQRVQVANLSGQEELNEYIPVNYLDDWDNFTIFNLIKLRHEVDTALEMAQVAD